MKHLPKSAPILTIISVLSLLLLAGCADTKWPSWLTGEPDDRVLNAPRVVGAPPSLHDTAWPNLASVPEKPKDFSTFADRKVQIKQLSTDKTESQEAKERIENEPLPQPLPPMPAPAPSQILVPPPNTLPGY